MIVFEVVDAVVVLAKNQDFVASIMNCKLSATSDDLIWNLKQT
jgi:hypothetical protein